mmetsp:Transcript_20769/g.49497  ORF Transcript_20769/g.49497 Transcript_20769/m.49497 type:complete len:214 (-) Transcript_20769:332-973(-)
MQRTTVTRSRTATTRRSPCSATGGAFSGSLSSLSSCPSSRTTSWTQSRVNPRADCGCCAPPRTPLPCTAPRPPRTAGAAKSWNVPLPFVSTILLPIVGNAAEHAAAVMFALKNKTNISLGVAIGSSAQITMLVIPFCVILGWAMGVPMHLNMHEFETGALFVSVVIVAIFLQDGSSNWLKGLTLVLSYLALGGAFYFHSDAELAKGRGGPKSL